jgi:hypothetical protein
MLMKNSGAVPGFPTMAADTTEFHIGVEEKEGECICPLS